MVSIAVSKLGKTILCLENYN